ncbi:MAG: hypothetical protein LQ347_007080 [Umbilicaria vellea]|nr:MAG: hypothetical protein LQ347_007080 [Umbilicaria vellea]
MGDGSSVKIEDLAAFVHSAEEGGYWAEVPALPGCLTQGETLDEVVENLNDAIRGWLSVQTPESLREKGVPFTLLSASVDLPNRFPRTFKPLITTPLWMLTSSAQGRMGKSRRGGRRERKTSLEKNMSRMRDVEPSNYEFMIAVHQDAEAAKSSMLASDTQYNRRTFIRTMLAAVEGSSYHLRQICLREAEISPNMFSPAEVAILKEEDYKLDSSGEATIAREPRYLRTTSAFRFSVNMTYKSYQINKNLDVSIHAWCVFKEVVEVRNRIVHPKSLAALTISDLEKEQAVATLSWVLDVLVTLYNDMTDVVKDQPMHG